MSRKKAIVLLVAAIVAAPVLTLGGMLAFGTAAPPPSLASVYDNVRRIDQSGLPPLARFTARDGSALAYRTWPGGGERVAVLVHGSSGRSSNMNPLAKMLVADGATVYAMDMRGHGESGRRGDIDYIGQMDDDMADFMALIKPHHPGARFTLIGFSSGGGFALRIAGGPDGDLFDNYVLLAPFLGRYAPSSRPDSGNWVAPYTGRIIALVVLDRLGIHWFDGLPALAFAKRPDPQEPAPLWSFRLMANFGPGFDAIRDFQRAQKPIALLDGGDDDEMVADAYAPMLKSLRPDIPVAVVPGVGHIGMTFEPAALAAIRGVFEASARSALVRGGGSGVR